MDDLVVTNGAIGNPPVLGSATIVPYGSGNGYSWKLNSHAFERYGTNLSIKDLPASQSPYSITVSDSKGCTEVREFVVNNCGLPPSPISGTLVEGAIPTTACSADGSMTATVTGNIGVPPFTFKWSSNRGFEKTVVDGTTPYTSTLTGLPSARYTVTITDYRCNSVVLGQVPLGSSVQTGIKLLHGVSTVPGCLRAIDLRPEGGAPPYNVMWSNGAATEDITDLTPGTSYKVTVTDKNGCGPTTKTINVNFPNTINIDATIVSACGGTAGSLTANPTKGKVPYRYAWSSGATTKTISGLAIGSYTVTVTDAYNCSNTASFSVTSSLVVDGKTKGSCEGSGYNILGSISSSVVGQVPPITYMWSNGNTTAEITNLTANGSPYTLTITDYRGCTGSKAFYISNGSAAAGQLMINPAGQLGCQKFGYCSPHDPNGLAISYFYYFDYTPNDPYCPCHSGGTLTCPIDNTIVYEIPAYGGPVSPYTSCEEAVLPAVDAFGNLSSSIEFSSGVGDLIINENGRCKFKYYCTFFSGSVVDLPGNVAVETVGYAPCSPSVKQGQTSDREQQALNVVFSVFPVPASDHINIVASHKQRKEVICQYSLSNSV